MANLGHYKNSRTSMNNYEPLYSSQWELIITPPIQLSQWDLVMENVTKVGGLDELYQFPELVSQTYNGADRNFIGGSMSGKTSGSITLDFEVNLDDTNSAFVYKKLRMWTDLIYDPKTGKFGMKKDYVGSAVLNWFNKNGDVFMQFDFPVIFPEMPVPMISELDKTSNDIYKISDWKLRVEFTDDTIK